MAKPSHILASFLLSSELQERTVEADTREYHPVWQPCNPFLSSPPLLPLTTYSFGEEVLITDWLMGPGKGPYRLKALLEEMLTAKIVSILIGSSPAWPWTLYVQFQEDAKQDFASQPVLMLYPTDLSQLDPTSNYLFSGTFQFLSLFLLFCG